MGSFGSSELIILLVLAVPTVVVVVATRRRDRATPEQTPAPGAEKPSAGWHPDPTTRHQLRYWNGDAWTAHVSDDGVAGEDPP